MAVHRRALQVAGRRRYGLTRSGYRLGRVPNGLALWIDASDDRSITHASDVVSAILNKAGAESFAQATAGSRPTRVAAGGGSMNGRQHLSFDAGDLLAFSGTPPLAGESGELWAVAETANAGTTNQTIYSQTNDGGTNQYVVCYHIRLSTRVGMAIYKATFNGMDALPEFIRTANTPYVSGFRSTGAAYGLNEDGTDRSVTVTSGANDGTWIADQSGQNWSGIGGHIQAGTPTQRLNGRIGAILGFNSVNPPTRDRACVLAFLGGWTP